MNSEHIDDEVSKIQRKIIHEAVLGRVEVLLKILKKMHDIVVINIKEFQPQITKKCFRTKIYS